MVLNLITRDLSKPKARRVAPSLLVPSLPEEKVDGDERIARQASPISIVDDFTIGDLVGESMAEGLRAVTPSPATATPSPEIICDYFERLGAAAVGAGAEQRVTPSPPVGLAAGPDAEWLLNATAGLRDKGTLRDEVAAPVPRRHSCPDLVERATGRADRRSPDMSLVAGVSDRFGFRSVADMKLVALVRSESNSSLADMASKSPDLSPRRALLRAASSPSFSRSARSYEAVVDPDAASVDPDAASDDGDRFLKENLLNPCHSPRSCRSCCCRASAGSARSSTASARSSRATARWTRCCRPRCSSRPATSRSSTSSSASRSSTSSSGAPDRPRAPPRELSQKVFRAAAPVLD